MLQRPVHCNIVMAITPHTTIISGHHNKSTTSLHQTMLGNKYNSSLHRASHWAGHAIECIRERSRFALLKAKAFLAYDPLYLYPIINHYICSLYSGCHYNPLTNASVGCISSNWPPLLPSVSSLSTGHVMDVSPGTGLLSKYPDFMFPTPRD